MALIVFKDELGDSLAIDANDIIFVERVSVKRPDLVWVHFTMGHRGASDRRLMSHTVEEVADAVNKVRGTLI
jgi:hypothetical protein